MSKTPTRSRAAHDPSSPARIPPSRAGHPYSQQSRSQSTVQNLRSRHFHVRDGVHPTDNNERPPSQGQDDPTPRRVARSPTLPAPAYQETPQSVANSIGYYAENQPAGLDDDEPYRASTRQLVEQLHNSQIVNSYGYDTTTLGQGDPVQQPSIDDLHDEMDWEWQTVITMHTASMYGSSDASSDEGTIRGSVTSFDGHMSIDPSNDDDFSLSSDYDSSSYSRDRSSTPKHDTRPTTNYGESNVDDYDLKEDDGENTTIPTADDMIHAVTEPTDDDGEAEDEGESEAETPPASALRRRSTRHASRRAQAPSSHHSSRPQNMLPTPRSSPLPQGSSSSGRGRRFSASQATNPTPDPFHRSPFPSPVRRRRAAPSSPGSPSTSRGPRSPSPRPDVERRQHGSLRSSRSY